MRTILLTLIAGGVVATTATAQNRSSFLRSSTSTVDYAEPLARASRACGSVEALTGFDVSIVSATLVPAANGSPEHCRVSGVIPSEIRFEVNLLTDWNRRLYMHGNGGFAGTPADAPGPAAVRDEAIRHGFATASS